MIGVISDSHDNLDAVRTAVALFKNAGCRLVLHAGDFVAPFAARELANLGCPVKAVFGNCDGEKQGLHAAIQPFGEIQEAPLLFHWEGFRFLLTHVDFSLKSYLRSHDLDYLVFGHSHKPDVHTLGKTLFLNPGECGGWVSGKKTVAFLNPETHSAEIVPL
jgi:putative phosphoesterase